MPRPLKKAKLAKERHQGLKFTPAASDSGSDGSMYEKSSSEGDESDEEVRVDAEEVVGTLHNLFPIFLPAKLRSAISSIKAAVQVKKRKRADRPAVYTGESRTTAWRKSQFNKKAAAGCKKLESFFVSQMPFLIDKRLTSHLAQEIPSE